MQPTALIPRALDSFDQAASAVIDAKRSEATRKAYRIDLRRWVLFCAEHRLEPTTPSIMATTAFRDELRKKVSEETARRTIAALSSIYGTLLKGRIVTANPFHPALLAWPVASKIGKTRRVDDDVARAMILNAIADDSPSGPRDAAILRLLYDTGLRRESVVTISRKQYQPPSLRTVIKGGEQVEVDLPEQTVTAIDRWLDVAPSSVYLFPGRDRGAHIDVGLVNKIVAARALAVGAEHIHPHCFRAAFATAGYDAQLPEYEIQAGMHHKDPSTTRRYDRGVRGNTTAIKIAEHRRKKSR